MAGELELPAPASEEHREQGRTLAAVKEMEMRLEHVGEKEGTEEEAERSFKTIRADITAQKQQELLTALNEERQRIEDLRKKGFR